MSFTYFRRSLSDQFGELEGDFGTGGRVEHRLEGEGGEGVAGEDGDVAVPFAVNRGLPPTDGRVVHDVVMDESEIVKHLEGGGGIEGRFRISVKKLGGHHN